MADVALVPEGDVFHRGNGVPTEHTREAGETLAGDGIALVRHGTAAFLAFRKEFLRFEDLGALQMAELDRPTFNAGGDERERVDEFGVEVALDDLRGNGRRTETKLFANECLHTRRNMRAGTDGAREFADRHCFPRGFD